MKTKSIGELLREEREAHRLPIEELAKRTRIRIEHLQALEENNFIQLPAATFVKGYIKSYAQIFGFDYRPLIALLRRDYKESAKGKLIPREYLKPVLRRRRYPSALPLTLFFIIGFIITTLGYIVWQWQASQQPPMLLIYRPENQAIVAPQVIVEGKTVIEAVITVNEQPVALQPDGSFRTEVFLQTEGINAITVESIDRRGKSQIISRTVYVEY